MVLPPKIEAILHAHTCSFEPCGSRVTCDPAPTNTDEDWIVYLPDARKQVPVSDLVGMLSQTGFSIEGGDHYQNLVSLEANSFVSLRCGDLNLIVTGSQKFWSRHRAATELCRTLNVLDKDHRIKIFQAVLYGDEG